MATHWDGLVLNNYEAVMPLTWNRKYGINYLYQPYFLAQLGITGSNLTPGIIQLFLNAIPSTFKYTDIDLNETNQLPAINSAITTRVNMVLDLGTDYEVISHHYHRLATRMLRKAREQGFVVELSSDLEQAIAFYKLNYAHQLPLKQMDYQKVLNMFAMANGRSELLSLVAKRNNIISGVYLLLMDENAVYSVLGGCSPEGKKEGCFYLLTDYAIKCSCGKQKVFRFEGSDIAGIAAFNKQFGAITRPYNHLKINRLPKLIQLFKK